MNLKTCINYNSLNDYKYYILINLFNELSIVDSYSEYEDDKIIMKDKVLSIRDKDINFINYYNNFHYFYNEKNENIIIYKICHLINSKTLEKCFICFLDFKNIDLKILENDNNIVELLKDLKFYR